MTGKPSETKNSAHPFQVVVMGVSGCGKSTVGAALAERLGAVFIDGDDLHPESNRQKMASGQPLNDDDRWPWLDLVAGALSQPTIPQRSVVIAASALRKIYRSRILASTPHTVFIHLTGSPELLLERLENRQNHFMKASMLASQLDTLEALEIDEPGQAFDISRPVGELVDAIYETLTN